MLRRILRVLIGFLLACLAAAAVTISFADIQELKTVSVDRANELLSTYGIRVLRLATIGALFSAPIAIVGILFAEWKRIQDWLYYTVLALIIATLGFMAWYSAEAVNQPTIINNYAMTAFLTSGFVGGLIYWLVSGNNAGKPYSQRVANDTFARTEEKTKAALDKFRAKPAEKLAPAKPDPRAGEAVKAGISKPEITKPEVTKPELTKPDLTKPGITKPDVTKPVLTKPELTMPELKKLKPAGAEAAKSMAKTVEEAAKTAEEIAKKATSVPQSTPDPKKT